MALTRVEKLILKAILLQGGQVHSLSRLADSLDLDYSNAYERVRSLERQRFLQVNKPGRDLVLSLGITIKPIVGQ